MPMYFNFTVFGNFVVQFPHYVFQHMLTCATYIQHWLYCWQSLTNEFRHRQSADGRRKNFEQDLEWLGEIFNARSIARSLCDSWASCGTKLHPSICANIISKLQQNVQRTSYVTSHRYCWHICYKSTYCFEIISGFVADMSTITVWSDVWRSPNVMLKLPFY